MAEPSSSKAPVFGPDGPIYLTTAELAARYRTAPSSISDWRQKGTGPLGVKFGRNVLYPLDEVEAWEARHVADSRREHARRAGGVVRKFRGPRVSDTPRRRTL